MIKAAIFDLNGIFLQSPGLEEGFRLSIKEFIAMLRRKEKVSEEMIGFAREFKKRGIKVFFLSNSLEEVARYYREQYPWIDEIADKVYFSFETGLKKPDTRAWENILSENDLKPEECVYFDDQEKHVAASQSVGIQAFLFTGEKDFQEKIRELKLL
ncbi:hypothetical protein A2738_02815 [Candidatus Nomurabacteria bacterium RIFCSPHIGHO2_01_FULL_42_15]|uniref:FCP1 homology domain-containing protein n=1 Tax=Candidatus Nomurabacteria bacterium RIFCSPHIGHO2_01_FULL_42_15 TaxID=1801742 RepID=A0A1F6VER0_9BACT|nr:MAG: hypothetical protein A2738_02815 [Candidatus Nomurabacteria bacterium RIFCSPHIGHO2_01_FULL_42_15]OGI92800.1 MAG: hypothetical protein A3A99_02880 [Candidatus Nomurabacteria bacterium RIFCSPLOWO2_01_FULL_41_18]